MNMAVAGGALIDISEWLGFADSDEYLDRLPIEREKIFERENR